MALLSAPIYHRASLLLLLLCRYLLLLRSKNLNLKSPREGWIKALLMPGEQARTACLMAVPSYQDKMAEPFCKQRYQSVCLWWVVLDSWDSWGEEESKTLTGVRQTDIVHPLQKNKVKQWLCNSSLSGVDNITSLHCDVTWRLSSASPRETPNKGRLIQSGYTVVVWDTHECIIVIQITRVYITFKNLLYVVAVLWIT